MPKRKTDTQLLRSERERRGWTQADVADRIGVVEKVVSNWERGTHLPYLENMIALCKLFARDIDEIFPLIGAAPDTDEGDAWIIPPFLRAGEILVGRQELLAALAEQICSDKCIALTGLPGVGKTALAVALVNHPLVRETFSDGLLWADLGPHPHVLEKLSDWAMHPRLSGRALPSENSLEAHALALHKAIGKRRMLLVANDAWEIDAALALKVGGPNCAFLVTTRLSHLALRMIPTRDCLHTVTELNAEDGLTLLEQQSPAAVTYDRQAAQMLVQEVGGLPLALMLLGRELDRQAHSGQPRRLREAFARLHNPFQRLRVSEPQSPSEHSPNLPSGTDLSLQALIAVSDTQLDEQARTMLRALSVFPPGANGFSEEAAVKVSQVSTQALDLLCDASLLTSSGTGRYTLHPTLIDYASSCLSEIMPSERFVAYYVSWLESNVTDHEALERDLHNLIAGLNYAFKNGQHVLFVRAVNLIVPFLLARGLYDLAALHLQRAYEVALWSAGAQAQILLRLNLGRTRYQQGEYKKAKEALGEVLNLARERAYHEQVCHLLILLSMVAIRLGEYREAEIRLYEGLMLVREGRYHDAQVEASLKEALAQLPAPLPLCFVTGCDGSQEQPAAPHHH